MIDGNRHHRPRSRSGMILLEMLFALLLATLAMNVGMRLFGMIARSYRDAPAAANEMQVQAQWLAVLRDDAWQARSAEINDGTSLTLAVRGGRIAWHQDAERLFREGDGEVRSWPLSRQLHWSDDRDILTVSDGAVHVPLAMPAREAVTP